jgi:hypothetical protein
MNFLLCFAVTLSMWAMKERAKYNWLSEDNGKVVTGY